MSPARSRRPALKPRKSPGQSRSAETVRTILEGAARVLEERGLDGYTTNAVAERAGVSIGSVYQYFPGKEALTAALVARETALLTAAVRAAPAAATPEDGLRRIVRACVAHQMARPRLALLLDREESRLQLADTLGSVAGDLTTALLALLARLGAALPAEPETAAGDLFALVRGMVDAAGERGERDGGALERRVLHAVHGYLGLPQAVA
ncbi:MULTISPECIES: TetR/AcrR family transcriptional regulator [unclassified Methylobacterium]|jgi:AcrR family transcriptional regulator|uniref:TetR/AcrR family transcriptional regulator n=1 Tax=unclassified Methylobacterium TaxID=2615210 RepID=UPI0013528199|nr:TetR/AcrR family transcriptional regulator [Methylobacterium sp. 2A]MWV23808.1 TetR/AcrR family transcriptional regulator [Methylobacterium sp. 2A]